MSIVNKVINYSSSATVAGILGALKDAMVALGWTVLEDSISGSDLFVVQAQQQSPSNNQQILEFRSFAPSSTYIAIVPWDSWTPGTPGSGGNSVYALDPARNSNSQLDYNYVLLDLTNGGIIFLDGDTDGSIVVVTGITYNNGWDPLTYLGVFGVLDGAATDTYPNYGALMWHQVDINNNLRSFNDGNFECCFVVPVNEEGIASAQMNWDTEPCCYEYIGVGFARYRSDHTDFMRFQPGMYAQACLDTKYELILPIVFGNTVTSVLADEPWNIEYAGDNSGGRPATVRGAVSGMRVLPYMGSVGVRCITTLQSGTWAQYRTAEVTGSSELDSSKYDKPIALPFTGDNFVFVEA